MTWTYSGDPSSSSVDAVRFYVQDTDTNDQLMTDEEIVFLLDQYGDPLRAAAAAAQALAMKFARMVDHSVDRVAESASQRSKQFAALADRLTASAGVLALPSIGGRSLAEKQALNENADGVQPEIKKDQFDYPGRPEF